MPTPSKRSALELLTKKRLVQLARAYELKVASSKPKPAFIDALTRSRRASFRALIGQLNRSELGDICRAHGLDASAADQPAIVARILAADVSADDPGAALGLEDTLWKAAELLRSDMDPAEYKHIVLGLIFLKSISDAFDEHRSELGTDHEDRSAYTVAGVVWVPRHARWSQLQARASQPTIGAHLDQAMDAIERDNPSLAGALPKRYVRPGLDPRKLGALVELIGDIGLGARAQRHADTLGRVYEYFLSRFASAESKGKGGGEFYTPSSVVRVLVEMLEPYRGRVYDPCCGSGGMFVQSLRLLDAHDGQRDAVRIYGQESNATTWRIARMNLAIRGIEARLGPSHADSFHADQHLDLRADFILANPPFNIASWGRDRLEHDPRWRFGLPPAANANFAWVQHIVHHLAPSGVAGVVLANGSMSAMQSGEGEIRQRLIEADLVECMVALPAQLFYATQIPVCLWILARDRGGDARLRDRRRQVLFIDARRLGRMRSRVHRVLDAPDIERISTTYHAWRSRDGLHDDVPGFCKSATTAAIASHGYSLTPGRYVDARQRERDSEPFTAKMSRLTATLTTQLDHSAALEARVRAALDALGHGR